MSFWCDNIHTTVFTPRDFQVELLAAAYERNICICLGHKSSKEFIALKLLQEQARDARTAGKVSLYLTLNGAQSMYTMLQNLTDLKVYQQCEAEYEFKLLPEGYHVYIAHPRSCLAALRSGTLPLDKVHLLILEDCHDIVMHQEVLPIFKEHFEKEEATNSVGAAKVLTLAGPLHSAGCALEELSAMLQALERNVHCTAETASDIVTVLRYCAKPIELIVQCAPSHTEHLATILDDIITTHKRFLHVHRYDPTEIYNTEEFLEELKDIPDPKKEPIEFLDIMHCVLHEMGPWAADRVAVNMFHRIEKQKIKTPHERHYLLLCFVNTALSKIHALCEQTFRKFNDHKQLVERYSSPKVLRLLEVLRLFRPDEFATDNETIKKITVDLERMDFQKLTRSIEYSCQNVEHIVKQQLESRSIIENLDPIVKPLPAGTAAVERKPQPQTDVKAPKKFERAANSRGGRPHGAGGATGRPKRRAFVRRPKMNPHGAESLDTLCGIVFCDSSYTARVLFDLLMEMSRHDVHLKFLKCQFTTDRMADPLTEPKEAEAEHRRQEDVLKRFRMHDCNLLIATAVLEEGIDVPKCNLVVRWDPPTTYRSYVQCKGRARAVPAYHFMLVAAKYDNGDESSPDTATATEDQLSARSHRYLCKSQALQTDDDVISDSDDSQADSTVPGGIGHRFTIGSSKGTVKILNPEVITNKPPTASEIILKEIEDSPPVLPAIEAPQTPPKSPPKSPPNTPPKSPTKTPPKSPSDSPSEDQGTATSDCFEVIDLDLAILNASGTPKPAKEKRRFQCLLPADAEGSDDVGEAAQLNNVEGYQRHLQRMELTTDHIVKQLAHYREIEKMLLRKCANTEPAEREHHDADTYNGCLAAYKPLPHLLTGAAVDLSSAIALVNRYCSKLPSDTFTKLTALWRCAKATRGGVDVYQYTVRMPINSPLKYDIVGLPMGTHILARRMAALQVCMALHRCGELDNQLQPIGKEGFRALESDWENFELEAQDERIVLDNAEPRPGTTKRRQYYYKRIASEFCHCRPTAGTPSYLYLLDLTLQCPIPEEQNTRGRKIYPPEEAQQGFGILTLKKIPKVSAFPIFTRSGEVRVSIVLAKERIVLTEKQIRCINTFVNYTFTNVLRLQKFLMLFDPDSTENCVFIVPTVTTATAGKVIDWSFLELIERNADMMPTAVPEALREKLEFDASKFRDAVVMPWYRNQDQPQYFYVAEICPQLSPLSCFPGENYRTFKHYYFLKYCLQIQNSQQPLLDVDHTSARLNFLTPRYVNRKGVALPTSSEETKRAKRENLEQKQILVPELCTVHPFPASLWRTAVCLPCILYRINGLLLADDIRKKVAADIALGECEIADDFEWPMLDFGWSLSEVLKKSKECKADADGAAVAMTNGVDVPKQPNGAGDAAETKADEPLAVEKSANEIVSEGEKKLKDSNNYIEIGTWSNEMADDIATNGRGGELSDEDDEEYMKYLPPNVSFCDQQMRYGSPTFWDVKEAKFGAAADGSTARMSGKTSSFAYYDSDDSLESSYDGNMPMMGMTGGSYSSDDDDQDSGPLRIAFTSKNEAETIETEQEIDRRNKQLSIIQATTANERNYQRTKNLQFGYNFVDLLADMASQLEVSVADFVTSTELLTHDIRSSGMLVGHDAAVALKKRPLRILPDAAEWQLDAGRALQTLQRMLPYADNALLEECRQLRNNVLCVDDVARLNAHYVDTHAGERFSVVGCGDVFDNFNDKQQAAADKRIQLNFDGELPGRQAQFAAAAEMAAVEQQSAAARPHFSFDHQPDLRGHPGPSPSIILQALTMSNANDGINLERLETIGDSFLKYAITTYLYITYENVHEGKLSHLRSKQVANLNLYRLGRRKILGEYMIATKFEPHDNWLPPCYYVPKELEKALIEAKIPPHHWKLVDLPNIKKLTSSEICQLVREKAEKLGLFGDDNTFGEANMANGEQLDESTEEGSADFTCFIPYNLVTQHSIPDKSVADCVEALIGAYLIECGPRGALLFMAWLGIRVLPYERQPHEPAALRVPGSTKRQESDGTVTVYGAWTAPKSPLLHYSPNALQELDSLLEGFAEFEAILGYRFRDRSYLLQAMTHASYSPNRLTDCYQRLEFLGDAVLDYLITRHLYEDPRQHSPGALTDLRSALVNNTIFASLAVRHGFHKYFRHLSPGLNDVIDRFVRIQNENGHSISEEYYLLSEEECDDAEDVEVPKALGDVFESIAGAIFLDSNMSLDVVWQVYSNMMKPEIEQFSNSVPKSPIRELLELEPETAKFGKPEKLADGRRVRVTVDVFCKGTFRGIGRNYRIAKCTAAKCALRQLKKQGLIQKKD